MNNLQRGESSVVDVSYTLSYSLSPQRESCKTWTSWMVLFLFPGLSGREREWSQCACSKLPALGQRTEGWAADTMSRVEGDYVNMWLCTCNNNCPPVYTSYPCEPHSGNVSYSSACIFFWTAREVLCLAFTLDITLYPTVLTVIAPYCLLLS